MLMSKRLCILLTICCIHIASGEGLTCWSGHDTSMSKQSCTPATTAAPHGEAPEGNSNDTSDGRAFCYELMYRESNNSMLTFETSPEAGRLTHINASCDTEGLCNSTVAWKSVKTVLNGFEVTLFCCDKNNCNKAKTFPALLPVCNRLKYNGTVAVASREVCSNTGDICLSQAQYQGGRLVSQVSICAAAKACEEIPEIDQHPQCHNKTENGLETETCCCHGDFCIPLPPNINMTELKDNNDTLISAPPIRVVVTHHKTKLGTDWLFVGGLIAAVVLVVVLVASVVTVWQIKRRKEAAARRQMMLSYTPISSSEVENSDLQILL